jgi:hypothetical protein
MYFLNRLYTQTDFDNLTKDDIQKIKSKLDIENEDIRDYLYRNINNFGEYQDVQNILASKLLAGQVTVKWLRFCYSGDFTEEKLKSRLESQKNGYNMTIEERLNDDTEDGIVCIQNNDVFYTVRIVLNCGTQKIVTNDFSYRRISIRKTIIVNVNIEKKWIELRCENKLINRVKDILRRDLGVDNIQDIEVTNKYRNIEEFKNDLCGGFRENIIATPMAELKLENEDKIEFAKMFSLLDDYIVERNSEKLITGLSELKLKFSGTPIILIILSNIGTMKFDVSYGAEEDYDQSLIHLLTKDFTTENSSYIKFSTYEGGTRYTLKLSIKDKSIRFVSSVTEDVIQYIRDKVV